MIFKKNIIDPIARKYNIDKILIENWRYICLNVLQDKKQYSSGKLGRMCRRNAGNGRRKSVSSSFQKRNEIQKSTATNGQLNCLAALT